MTTEANISVLGGNTMKTKRVLTIEDTKEFFKASINSIEDAYGKAIVNKKNHTILFDFTSVLLLSFDGVIANVTYDLQDPMMSHNFRELVQSFIHCEITDTTEAEYSRVLGTITLHFVLKLETISENTFYIHIINYEKLLETERELSLLSNVLDKGSRLFIGSTWWIDNDKFRDRFFQTDEGPRILGMPISEDKIYNTREFQKVRENAKKVSPFYDECIAQEQASFELVRHNKTDYFSGRTPARTYDNKIVWVEAYGKCFLRYKDGSPRFFVAIDIYLSDVFESVHQLGILNNLMNSGMINSDVGLWYYQRHYTVGRYYFTRSHRHLMGVEESFHNDNVLEVLDQHFKAIEQHTPEYAAYFVDFRQTHRKIFTGELDKYKVVIPNNLQKDKPQWIEVRGTVLERDEQGDVTLFVGVNVDITQSTLKSMELMRLSIQNERLQLAEKLAIKAGNVIVWYQDEKLIIDNNQVFGNDMFSQKLGIPRNEKGVIDFRDLRRSIATDTNDARNLAKVYLHKLEEIYSNKANSLKNLLVKHKNLITGELYYFEHSIDVERRNADGSINLIGGFMLDVTENISKQERITYLANYDILTGVHNRNYFDNFINRKDLPENYTVILLDVDGLKLINDAFGHTQGDLVIQELAIQLKIVFKESILIARIGGDEFVVIVHETSNEKITRMVDELDKLIDLYNKESHIKMNVSKGAKEVIDNNLSFDKAFIIAENLMYRRKLNNRSSRKSKVLESIIETLNAKTEETKEHSERMTEHALKTLRELGFFRASEKEDISLLARVHDIGKITIPDHILNKVGRLDQAEFEVIKKHCEAGYKIIKNITDSDNVSDGVLYHHERFDGTGYPQGLAGDEIPVFARITSVVDAFDAMTNNRVYQTAKTVEDAIVEIKKCSGTQFDPLVVRAFLKSCFGLE